MQIFFFALLICAPLCATSQQTSLPRQSDLSVEEHGVFLKEHHPMTSHVDVMTGEHVHEQCDLVVAGAEPLSVRRFYGHFSSGPMDYNFWRYNPEHMATANFDYKEQPRFIAIGESTGVVHYFDQVGKGRFQKGTFRYDDKDLWMHMEETGQTHPANTTACYAADSREQRFRWEGKICNGAGVVRTFRTARFCWGQDTRNGPREIEEMKFNYGIKDVYPDMWTPFKIPIVEERLANGNIIKYSYEEKRGRAGPSYLLKNIEAYNGAQTRLLASLSFRYAGEMRNGMRSIVVTGSDGREVVYTCKLGKGTHTSCYQHDVKAAGQPAVTYFQEGHQIYKTDLPDGRKMGIEYAMDDRVSALKAAVGVGGQMVAIANYSYQEGITRVEDGEGYKKRYFFDKKKRLERIEWRCDGLQRCDRFIWDEKSGDLLVKIIEDGAHQLVSRIDYHFDRNHNVIENIRSDGQMSYACRFRYSTDGFNLKLEEKDECGRHIRYDYLPSTNLLRAEFVLDGEKICKRCFRFYDDCAICVKKIVDDGCTENESDLAGVTVRKIELIKPRYEHPCFGLPQSVEERYCDENGIERSLHKVAYTYTRAGQILKEDHFDASGVYRYSIEHTYDERERRIATVNALGQRQQFFYDDNNNLLKVVGEGGFCKEWVYDKGNRPIVEWDNGLKREYNYDKLNRLVSKRDENGQVIHYEYDKVGYLSKILYGDGSCETRVSDVLGRVVRSVDVLGYETVRGYHLSGQPVIVHYPDGREQRFTYRGDGKVVEQIDCNGARHIYDYDVFGNVICHRCYGADGRELSKESARFGAFGILEERDAAGLTTCYRYDRAGRRVAMERFGARTEYGYDELGRQNRIWRGDVVEVVEYDLLDRPTERRVENLSCEVQRWERYGYDLLGNLSREITFRGVTETVFNSRKEIVKRVDALGNCTHIEYRYEPSLVKKVRQLVV